MMKYTYSIESENRHLIRISCESPSLTKGEYFIQLPAWRPGRYELGNFAKNITGFEIKDGTGRKLSYQKVTKDKWRLDLDQNAKIIISYHYYASEINAGSSYADDSQLYVNPVNLSVYIEGRIDEPCEVFINVPGNYTIATSMDPVGDRKFKTSDFHELADSPFIASAEIHHDIFNVGEAKFHLWFQGNCDPNFLVIKKDFSAYTEAMLRSFGSFPFKEYHYLVQVLPNHFYHGVEHLKSTVIALGPGYKLMDHSVYDELLGVCCHELYHSWNIKTIRPVEMMPYNYTAENYTRLGYVAEGVTTYYGDLYLLRSKVFSPDQYLHTLTERYQKHLDNPGRFNMPVAEASFDTWLDGYVAGIPNRKTSIYDEGCIMAFITDVLIRKHSNNQHDLDKVMRSLYEHASKNQGYTAEDYLSKVNQYAGVDLNWFFEKYINGVEDTTSLLLESLDYLGLGLIELHNPKAYEESGFRGSDDHGYFKVTAVIPNSAADKSGLSVGDKIIAFNEWELHHNLHELFQTTPGIDPVKLGVFSKHRLKELILNRDDSKHFQKVKIVRIQEMSEEQERNYKAWSW